MKKKLPNIVLIVMDTVGAKHMSLYGYHRKTNPNLERIAAECTVYARCYAPSCWTVPSHASMFTGLYPSQHGAFEGKFGLNDNVQHLGTVLKLMGYRTLGISSNPLVSPDSGICRDFDYFKTFGTKVSDFWKSLWSGLDEKDKDELVARLVDSKTYKKKLTIVLNYIKEKRNISIAIERVGSSIISKLIRKVKSSFYSEETINLTHKLITRYNNINDQPFFLFINLMEAHDFYRPPLRWRRFSKWYDKQRYGMSDLYKIEMVYGVDKLLPVYGNLYNDEIYYLDDIVYRLWDIIATSRDRDETIFIITSDHGEHLGEKGFYGHWLSLHNELVWVPLIINFPKALNKKGREDRLVSLNDLYSTILDVVQSPLPRPETSFSLLDGHEREVILSQHIYPEFFRSILGTKTELSQLKGVDFSPSVLAIITAAGIKIMESRDGSLQVYNLQNDPDEHHDLAPTMSLDALNQLRLMMELFKEDTSYREALEEVSRLKPMFAEENLL